MSELKKTETEAIVKTEPVFMNKTKIDQVVYDRSNSAETIRPGKTVTGEWYRKYAGKRKSPLTLVGDPDADKENHPSVTKEALPAHVKGDATKGKVGGSDSKSKK